MASSKDFERIWKSYHAVSQSKGISIVDYCQRNGIVYSQFQRWYQKHISGVSIVPVEDIQSSRESPQPSVGSPASQPEVEKTSVVRYVCIELATGLRLCQRSLDYSRLKLLVERLEGLC